MNRLSLRAAWIRSHVLHTEWSGHRLYRVLRDMRERWDHCHWFHQSGCCVAHFRQDWRKTRLMGLTLASVQTLTARYRDHFTLNYHHFGSGPALLMETHFEGLEIIGHLVVIVEHFHGSISVTFAAHWGLSVCNVATDRTHGRLPSVVQCCRWWPTVQCTAHTVQLYNNIGRNVTGTQAYADCDQEIKNINKNLNL